MDSSSQCEFDDSMKMEKNAYCGSPESHGLVLRVRSQVPGVD